MRFSTVWAVTWPEQKATSKIDHIRIWSTFKGEFLSSSLQYYPLPLFNVGFQCLENLPLSCTTLKRGTGVNRSPKPIWNLATEAYAGMTFYFFNIFPPRKSLYYKLVSVQCREHEYQQQQVNDMHDQDSSVTCGQYYKKKWFILLLDLK